MDLYQDLKTKQPEEKSKVLCAVHEKPMRPKEAMYKDGKFYDIDDNIELFPTHWKYC